MVPIGTQFNNNEFIQEIVSDKKDEELSKQLQNYADDYKNNYLGE